MHAETPTTVTTPLEATTPATPYWSLGAVGKSIGVGAPLPWAAEQCPGGYQLLDPGLDAAPADPEITRELSMADRPGEFGVQHLLQFPGHPLGRGGQPHRPGRRRHPRAAPVGDHPPALGPGHQPAGAAQPLQSTSHRRPFHPQLCGHRRGGNRYPLTGIQTSSQHHQHLQLGGSHRRITRSLGQRFPGENALRSYRNCVRHRHRCYRLRPPDHPQPGPPAPAMLRPGRGRPWGHGQMTRNGRPVYDSRRGQPEPLRAKGLPRAS